MHELLRELESPDPEVAREAYAKVPAGPLSKEVYVVLMDRALFSKFEPAYDGVWKVLAEHARDREFIEAWEEMDIMTKRYISEGLQEHYNPPGEYPFGCWCCCPKNANTYKIDPRGPLADMANQIEKRKRRTPVQHNDFSRVALI